MINLGGQLIRSKEISSLQAANYYFGISDLGLSAGNYYLQIIFKDKTVETKKLYINH